MAKALQALGTARIFRDPRTGKLVVDTDSLRRGGFAGDDEVGSDPDYGDEEDDEDGDEFGEDDFGDDEEVGDDDFGAQGRGRRRRLNRKQGRLDRKRSRLDRRTGSRRPRRDDTSWAMTAIGGTDSLEDAGAANVKIRLQHDFRAQDVTFTGSAAGAKVTSIFFGDRVVWSNSDGIDAGVFASTGFLRGLLRASRSAPASTSW